MYQYLLVADVLPSLLAGYCTQMYLYLSAVVLNVPVSVSWCTPFILYPNVPDFVGCCTQCTCIHQSADVLSSFCTQIYLYLSAVHNVPVSIISQLMYSFHFVPKCTCICRLLYTMYLYLSVSWCTPFICTREAPCPWYNWTLMEHGNNTKQAAGQHGLKGQPDGK